MDKRYLVIEEFELDKPDNYEEMLKNADALFAELLIKYYSKQRKCLTEVNYGGNIIDKQGELQDG